LDFINNEKITLNSKQFDSEEYLAFKDACFGKEAPKNKNKKVQEAYNLGKDAIRLWSISF
jgi:hypothetical protein